MDDKRLEELLIKSLEDTIEPSPLLLEETKMKIRGRKKSILPPIIAMGTVIWHITYLSIALFIIPSIKMNELVLLLLLNSTISIVFALIIYLFRNKLNILSNY